MLIKFTHHALTQMKSRNITTDKIKKTLDNPDKLIDNSFGNKIAQKLFGNILYRVVFFSRNNEKVIITAYKTTKFKNYL